MGQFRRRSWHPPWSRTTVIVAVFSPLAVLQPATLVGADSAAAAPAAGYTATLIPTGVQSTSVAVDPATDTAYFGDDVADELTVIDGATNTATATIALPGRPIGIAVDPVTDTAYVTVLPRSTADPPIVDVLDGATNTVTATITLPAGSTPFGVAVDSSTNTVYVAEQGADAVAVINGSTNSVTATVSMGSGFEPFQLAVDETTDRVWVASAQVNVLAVISGNNDTVTQTVSLGYAAEHAVAIDPVTDTVYAAIQSDTPEILVIDGTTGTVSKAIAIPVPALSIAVDPGAGTVFASTYAGGTGSGTTWVIDESSSAITDTIPRGGEQIAVDMATGSAYAAPFSMQADAVWVLKPSASNGWSPVIKSTSRTLTAGTAGSFAIVGTALPAATYSETGPLPSGVTLSAPGVLSGTPAAGTGGVYPVTLTASNGVPPDYSEAFTLTIDEAPSIATPSSTTFRVGQAVDVPLQIAPGFPATIVSAAAANLPAGLEVTLQAGGWALTGTPAAGSGGVHDVDFFASNGAVAGHTKVPITIMEAPAITSAATTTFLADSFGLFVLSARGYPAPAFTVTGGLPEGVSLLDGQLVEEPPLGIGGIGTHRFTINASNSAGTASQAFTLIVRSPVAVGAEGSDGQLWVQAPQLSSGWHPLGGRITAPPAVAAPPNLTGRPVQPLFIATGTDKHLYIRSLTAGWQELGPATASCLGAPAAVITGTPPSGPFMLTVACRGTDNALWEDSTTLPASGLPQFASRWTRLGGVLTAGPAAAPVGGTMTFFVRGTNGRIYARTLTRGYTVTPWSCVGQPSAASVATGSITYLAFQGTDHELYEAHFSGSAWSPLVPLGGSLIGSPAVAANGGEPYLIAEGTDHAAWERSDSYGWSSIGGSVVGGVGAANLTS